ATASLTTTAQGTAAAPEALTEGTKTVAIDEYGYRQVFYYSYTSNDEDRLLSLTLPTSTASVIVSYTGGDPYQSEFPSFCVGDDETSTTSFACYAPKEKTIYLKVTLQVLAFPAGTTSAEITVNSTPCENNDGRDLNNPIKAQDGSTVFLPLNVDTEPPFLPMPTYVSYTVEHDGWLYLNFKPSVTSIYYRYQDEENEDFTFLKSEYVMENGKTVGTKAILKVDKNDKILFEIKGFNGDMLTTTLENPDPGTSCDFPLLIEEPGLIAIPDEPGDWYWAYTPAHEGFIELTSDLNLEGGHIEVMMDCNHTGTFTIYDDFHLRAWVYDRIQYLIHLKKDVDSENAQYLMALSKPLPCDDFDTAENLVSGQEYTTPDFAGTYYYRIAPSADKFRNLVLRTDATDLDSRTRVNLYDEEDLAETLARGLDMKYKLEPAKAYILKWTVFDNETAIPFTVTLTDDTSGVADATIESNRVYISKNAININSVGENIKIFSIDGRVIFNDFVDRSIRISMQKGVYMMQIGNKTEKIIIP
ncbi:MAG: T9SS type A sorting domain-containing protein, partial [Muribaculaceae bacterium]|nr:T9SS type A sorting domain-containing protein [Muribaculaceae bacterium]